MLTLPVLCDMVKSAKAAVVIVNCGPLREVALGSTSGCVEI